MKYIDVDDIKEKIIKENKIKMGKETNVYKSDHIVIKLFRKDRKSPFDRISDEGLIKLSELDLKIFNNPIDIIVEDSVIVGYTERYLNIKDYEGSIIKINFDALKEDIKRLSYNGFKIEDIFYNYTFDDDLIFFDMTSYKYTNTKKKMLLDYYYKKNIATINLFLVGLTMFDAYKHGESYEFLKTFKANEYINKNIKDKYYADYLKEKNLK